MKTSTDKDYKILFDSNPFPLIVYDAGSFKILDANTAAVDLYGYARHEMLSLNLNDLLSDNKLAELYPPPEEGKCRRVYHRKKDGTEIPLNVKSSPISFEGKPAKLDSIIPEFTPGETDYLKIHYTAVVDASEDAIISKNLDGIIMSWSKGAERMYGYRAAEVIGRNIDILTPPDKKDETGEIMNAIGRGERFDHFETRRVAKDGTVLYVVISVSPLQDTDGNIIGATATARNISRTKETLARLEENDIIFKHLIENLTEVFYVSDPRKPEIIYMSKAIEKVFGESVNRIYQNPLSYLDFIVDEDLGKARRALAKQIKGISTDYIFRIIRRDGSIRHLRERAFPVKNIRGEVFRIIGVAEDITDRIESEIRLKDSEYRYRSIFESATVSMWESDFNGVQNLLEGIKRDGTGDFRKYLDEHPEFVTECIRTAKIIDVNPKTVALFRAADKEHLVNHFADLRTTDFDNFFKEMLIVFAGGGKHFESEFEMKTFSGERLSIYSITSFPGETSPYRYTLSSLIDISERKRTERALSESEQRFRVMADTAPVLIWTAGPDKSFYYFNKPWLDFTGRTIEEETGEGWMERIHPIDRPQLKAVYDTAFESKEEFRHEFRVRRSDGRERWLLSHGVPRYSVDGTFQGYIGSAVDITERKLDEVELSKSLAREKRALRQAEKVQNKLKYLAEASIILNSSLDYAKTMGSLARLLTPAVCDWFVVDLYFNDKLRRLTIYHENSDKIQLAEEMQEKYPPDMQDGEGIPRVIRTGESLLIKKLSDKILKENIKNEELLNIFSRLGIRSVIIVPLKLRERILGAITLCTAESGNYYDEDDLGFAEDIAHRASVAIDNAHLFRQIEELNRNLEYTIEQQQKEIKYRKKIEKELRESEERFRLITENSNDFISLLDENDRYIFTNRAFTRMLGYEENDIVGKVTPFDICHPEDRELLKQSGISSVLELRYRRKDGGYVWVESSSLKVVYHGKQVTIRISRNINERKRIENERERLYSQLEEQRIRIDNLVANIPGVVWEAYGEPDAAYQRIDFVSNYAEKMLGYSIDEWLNTPNFWLKIVHPDDREASAKYARQSYDEKKESINRFRWIAKDGSVLWIESYSTSICDGDGKVIGMRGVSMNITEQMKFEQQLSSSLKEKEILLKEIHHRVKNNMQVISSLLSLQAKTIPDKKTQEVFDESRNRIRSMALIHEKLYQSKDLFRIDFRNYVVDLLNNLMISYGFRAKNIEARVNVEDIVFDINIAITLGLIINELASNSYKHAFRDRRDGCIEVSIMKKEMNLILIVKDNGSGIPEGADLKKSESLGLQLVDTLIEQLYGKFEIINDGGTEVRIEFPDPGVGEGEREE
jgi:PAS domain S-box-containing protein